MSVRGGHWQAMTPFNLRSTLRYTLAPAAFPVVYAGVRVCADLPAPSRR